MFSLAAINVSVILSLFARKGHVLFWSVLFRLLISLMPCSVGKAPSGSVARWPLLVAVKTEDFCTIISETSDMVHRGLQSRWCCRHVMVWHLRGARFQILTFCYYSSHISVFCFFWTKDGYSTCHPKSHDCIVSFRTIKKYYCVSQTRQCRSP